MFTINGIAYDGTATTATTKNVAGILASGKAAFTPTNMTLATSGEAGTYIGAVEPIAADDYRPAAMMMGY